MFFIILARFRTKPTEHFLETVDKMMKSPPPGCKFHNAFWTLGRYDVVAIFETPNEKDAFKITVPLSNYFASETLVAITSEEALKLMHSP